MPQIDNWQLVVSKCAYVIDSMTLYWESDIPVWVEKLKEAHGEDCTITLKTWYVPDQKIIQREGCI